MKIILIAWSAFRMPESAIGTPFNARAERAWLDGEPDAPADLLAEMAGRLCHDIFTLPKPATATNEGYLETIIGDQQFSVLEHGSASFLIENVSRSLLTEMRTHRSAGFSSRSTRFVDESEAPYVVPPVLGDYVDTQVENEAGWTLRAELDALMEHSTQIYGMVYETLVAGGATREEAREAAREFLPAATETKFVMTANHHVWRDILRKRLSPDADREMQEVSAEILRQLKDLAPHTYQDIVWP